MLMLMLMLMLVIVLKIDNDEIDLFRNGERCWLSDLEKH